jgi:release factor glutamine methyltransferase
MEVRAAVAAAASRLAAAGVASARVEAELLAAHVLGVSRSRLPLAGPLTESQRTRLTELAERRAATRMPLQHLIGTVGFGRRELLVGPGVFVPRPETELLAEWAIGVGGSVVVDLCAGSGALALAIADALPDARVYAVESAASALEWLRRNASGTLVEVVAGDATDPAVLADLDGTVDLVVTNPPYVPEGTPVPPEVSEHEPPEAVFAGADGLAVIRPLIRRAAALLRPGGRLGLEHDESHDLADLLRPWFTEIADHRDLAGRPRFVTARKAAK